MAYAIPCSLSYPLLSFLGLEAYCLIEILYDSLVSSISTEELVLPRHANVSSFVSLQRTQLTVKLLSFGLTQSSIFSAAPADTRPRTSLISFCTAQLQTVCARRSMATFCLCDLWSRPWRVARLLGLYGLPPYPYLSEGIGKQHQQQSSKLTLFSPLALSGTFVYHHYLI